MGLGFLGRGGGWRAARVALVHLIGAALGGGLIGGLLGWIGSAVPASRWRPGILLATGALALFLSFRRQPELGLQCQVPRHWNRIMSAEQCYAVWGLMLGSGVATLIPYSGLLLLLGAQLTAGVAFAGLSGAVFGTARESMSLFPLLWNQYREDPPSAMRLLPALRTAVHRLNSISVAGGMVWLMVASLR